MKRFLRIGLCCSLGLMLSGLGCSKESRVQRHRERAREHFEAGRIEEAMIEGLNAYRLAPSDPGTVRILALAHVEARSFAAAFPLLRKAIDLTPEDLETRQVLARLLYLIREHDEARAQAAFIVGRQPTNLAALKIWCATARTAGQVREAEEHLEKYGGAISDAAAVHLLKGQLALSRNDLAGAESAFRSAAELDHGEGVARLTLGRLYLQQGRAREAAAEIEKSASGGADFPPGVLSWAELKARGGDLAESRRILENLVAGSPGLPDAVLKLVEIDVAEGRVDAAVERLDALIAREPAFLPAYGMRAHVRWLRGDRDEALAELRALAAKYPRYAPFTVTLGALLFAQGEVLEAVPPLTAAVELDPGSAPPRLMLAEAQIRLGKSAEAVTTLRGLQVELAHSARANLLLGQALLGRKEVEAAVAALGRAVELAPEAPQAHYLHGLALRAAQKPAESRQALERALSAQPEFYPALWALADGLRQDASLGDAITRVQQSIAMLNEAAEPWMLLAELHVRGRDWANAERAYRAAIERAPGLVTAHQGLAEVCRSTGRIPEAVEHFEKALSLRPDDVILLTQSAMLHQQHTGDRDRARRYYEKVLELQPNAAGAANNLAMLIADVDPERAYQLAERAVATAPGSAAAQDTLGWLTHLRGDSVRGLALVSAAAARATNDVEALYHLGWIQAAVGDEMEGLTTLRQALSLKQGFPDGARVGLVVGLLETSLESLDRDTWDGVVRAEPRLESYPPVAFRGALLRERAGDTSGAVTILSNLTMTAPAYYPAALDLSRLLGAAPERGADALKVVARAHQVRPGVHEVAIRYAQLLLAAGEHRKAQEVLHGIRVKAGGDPRFLGILALARLALGDVAQARQGGTAALAISRNFAGAEQVATMLEMLPLAESPPGTPAALQRIKQVLAANPADVAARYALIAHEEKAGAPDQVVKLCDQLLKDCPDFTPAIRKLSASLYDYGLGITVVSPEAATAVLTRALQLDPLSRHAAAAREALKRIEREQQPLSIP